MSALFIFCALGRQNNSNLPHTALLSDIFQHYKDAASLRYPVAHDVSQQLKKNKMDSDEQ